jgi:hypothetical protein
MTIRMVYNCLLLALILVCSLQLVHFPESMEGFFNTVLAEIKDAIKCVAVVVAFTASYTGPQASTKNFMDPCCFCELGINFSKLG